MAKRIYIAEDHPIHVKFLRAALSKEEGIEPIFFVDGLELYRAVQKDKPDLLLLDIILPGMSGLAIARLLKFHGKYRDIPIIVSSSITDLEIQERALNAGADTFLAKPIKVQELLDQIKRLLGGP